jgi:PAS domain S-box-containing protein
MALYVSAPDGTILDANPAMVELLGYPDKATLLQVNAFDVYVDRDARRWMIEALEHDDLLRDHEVQFRRYDGSTIWVLDHARAIRDRRGRVKYYEGSLEDITHRKRAEEELQAAHETLGALIQHSPVGIVSLDLEGRVVMWNPAAERIFGWSEGEVVGRPLPVVPEEERDGFERLIERIRRGEQISEMEVRRRRRDGSVIHISLSAGPLRDLSGAVVGTIAAVVDVTERKRTEEMRRRLAEILEATPDLVGIFTAKGVSIFLNAAGRKLLGLGPDEPLGSAWDYLCPPHRRRIRDEAIPVAVREGAWSGEAVVASRDGREIPISLSIVAHRAPDGVVDHFSTVARDLTEQKRLERRLREAQTMDAIGRLAGGIAHDFNNLLTAILGNAELLLGHLGDDQARADVLAIKAAGERAATLTSHLLAFGRRQIGRPERVDLNELIGRLDARLRELARDGIELATELDPAGAVVEADPMQMEEAICRLVENACEAMPEGGRLTIRTARAEVSTAEARVLGLAETGPHVLLAVADTGIGMDEETRSRIFEPFFSTKKEVKGTGLGLASVYGIVKQNGGAIQVDSEPGRGTRVTVYLPARAREPAAAESPADEARTDTTTVMVVEDEPAVLGVAARVLRTMGLTVLEARNGAEALELLDSHDGRVDLLITDVVMPKLRGPDLAERVRHAHPETRVIFMSGYSDSPSVADVATGGSAEFIPKPFTPSELTEAVRRTLGAKAPRPPGQR